MLPIGDLAEAGAIILLLGDKLRQKVMERKMGVGGNPSRCKRHGQMIQELKDRLDNEIAPDLTKIKDKLGIV